MKRKDFLRKLFFLLPIPFIAKAMPVPISEPIKSTGICWEPLPLIPSRLKAAIVNQKLQNSIMKKLPTGNNIDLKYLREELRKLKN